MAYLLFINLSYAPEWDKFFVTCIKMEGLNDYSQRFCDALLGCHPELTDAIKVDLSEAVERGSLLVSIEPPTSNLEEGLWISTDNLEVTIGFDTYHRHFGSWTGATEPESFEEALTFLDEVLSDKALAVTWYMDQEALGGTTISPGGDITPSDTWATETNRVRVRSWSGKYDQDLEF